MYDLTGVVTPGTLKFMRTEEEPDILEDDYKLIYRDPPITVEFEVQQVDPQLFSIMTGHVFLPSVRLELKEEPTPVYDALKKMYEAVSALKNLSRNG